MVEAEMRKLTQGLRLGNDPMPSFIGLDFQPELNRDKLNLGEGLKASRSQLKRNLAKKLFEMLMYMSKKECVIEQNRNKLARMEKFQPRQAF